MLLLLLVAELPCVLQCCCCCAADADGACTSMRGWWVGGRGQRASVWLLPGGASDVGCPTALITRNPPRCEALVSCKAKQSVPHGHRRRQQLLTRVGAPRRPLGPNAAATGVAGAISVGPHRLKGLTWCRIDVRCDLLLQVPMRCRDGAWAYGE
jgi:hypothetical protein